MGSVRRWACVFGGVGVWVRVCGEWEVEDARSGGRVSDLFGAPLVHRTGGPLETALG